jgi:hypothetical protein
MTAPATHAYISQFRLPVVLIAQMVFRARGPAISAADRALRPVDILGRLRGNGQERRAAVPGCCHSWRACAWRRQSRAAGNRPPAGRVLPA